MNNMIKKLSTQKPELKRIVPFIAAMLCVLLTSCVDENIDDCPPAIKTTASLRFEYTLNDSYKDLLSTEVTHLDLLVYDKDGSYLKTYQTEQSKLQNGNTFPLDLEAGIYTLVAWANITTDYQTNFIPKLEDMFVKLSTSTSGEANPTHGSIFHGMTTMNIKAQQDNRATVSLTKNTNLLNVILEDTDDKSVLKEGDFKIQITGCNGTYNYENKMAGGELLNYIPRYTNADNNTMQAQFTLLRLLQDDDLRITITTPKGDVIYDEALTAKIMESPDFNSDEDLDRTQEYTLRYEITQKDGAWSIDLLFINDWDVTKQNGGIG